MCLECGIGLKEARKMKITTLPNDPTEILSVECTRDDAFSACANMALITIAYLKALLEDKPGTPYIYCPKKEYEDIDRAEWDAANEKYCSDVRKSIRAFEITLTDDWKRTEEEEEEMKTGLLLFAQNFTSFWL